MGPMGGKAGPMGAGTRDGHNGGIRGAYEGETCSSKGVPNNRRAICGIEEGEGCSRNGPAGQKERERKGSLEGRRVETGIGTTTRGSKRVGGVGYGSR